MELVSRKSQFLSNKRLHQCIHRGRAGERVYYSLVRNQVQEFQTEK